MRWQGRVLALSIGIAVIGGLAVPSLAVAAGLCVGGPGCYPTLQAAVDAAHDGDTIRVAPGTYAGGVTIDASVRLAGAGPRATIISGGGPVLTIGVVGASSEPAVSIDGVTITGGVSRSSPLAPLGPEGVIALGGGIEVPPNADFSGGAAVTISNSVITGNRVAPAATAPLGPACPGGPCPFALAGGGGIDTWGDLTLTNTSISNNLVGTPSGLSTLASDANGGGVLSHLGAVTISHSKVSGNAVGSSAPNGRFAEGGGIVLEAGTLALSDSAVSGNSATLTAALPDSVELTTVAGGIHLEDRVTSAAIRRSSISGNSVTMTNTVGSTNSFSGGVHVDVGVGTFSLGDSVVADNTVVSRTLAGSTGTAGGDSAAGEIHGTITNTLIARNVVEVSSVGDAFGTGGAGIIGASFTNSAVVGNVVRVSARGAAFAAGGGLFADQGGLTLSGTHVSGNSAEADAQGTATGRGGGIFDQPVPNGPPGGPLTLLNSSVTANRLGGTPGASLQGGGIFLDSEPLTRTNSVVALNVPDQCVGC